MKNRIKTIRLIAVIAVITFAMAACGGDDTTDEKRQTTKATYTAYDADGNAYTLVITKTADNPQNGDAYVLTITNTDYAVTGKSTGTVSTVTENGSSLTLSKSGSMFTVTVSGSAIANISDSIPLDAGGTQPSVALSRPSLDVNAGSEFRNVTHCASGSLYGVVEDIPSNLEELVKPLNPNMFANPARAGSGFQQPKGAAIPVAERLVAAGIPAKVTIRLADLCPGWPYQFPGWNSWKSQVESVIAAKLASSAENFYGYEIWNEWHGTWFGTWQNNAFQYPSATWTWQQRSPYFYAFWRDAYDLIREKDPGAKIIGSSDSYFNADRIRSFLEYCKENECIPDIICWHELGGVATITDNVNNYRAIERQLGIPPRPISINEYGESQENSAFEGNPGRSAAIVAKIERLNVETACISWWHSGIPGNLGSLLSSNTAKGAGWYFYKWYGDMSGKMISVTPPNTNTNGVDGFANIDHNKKFVSLLFGGQNDPSNRINVTFSNLPSWMGATATVKVEAVDWVSIGTMSNGPRTISEEERSITNNVLTVSVTGCNGTSGYRIYITPVSATDTQR
ncbi:hypothetical protein [Treponema sp. R80B11-R83G3]